MALFPARLVLSASHAQRVGPTGKRTEDGWVDEKQAPLDPSDVSAPVAVSRARRRIAIPSWSSGLVEESGGWGARQVQPSKSSCLAHNERLQAGFSLCGEACGDR